MCSRNLIDYWLLRARGLQERRAEHLLPVPACVEYRSSLQVTTRAIGQFNCSSFVSVVLHGCTGSRGSGLARWLQNDTLGLFYTLRVTWPIRTRSRLMVEGKTRRRRRRRDRAKAMHARRRSIPTKMLSMGSCCANRRYGELVQLVASNTPVGNSIWQPHPWHGAHARESNTYRSVQTSQRCQVRTPTDFGRLEVEWSSAAAGGS